MKTIKKFTSYGCLLLLMSLLSSCYSNDKPDTPLPLEIRYQYPMQVYNFDNYDNLSEQIKQNWSIVSGRVFIVNNEADFPRFVAFDNPEELDHFNFSKYSMLVYYSRELAPVIGNRYSFYKNPDTGGYLYDIVLKQGTLDEDNVRQCFVRNIIVVNKIDATSPINVTVYYRNE